MDFKKLPAIIVTGASGFIGKYFLEAVKENFIIFAIARRSQKEAKAPKHRNINWIMVDIANKSNLKREIFRIKKETSVEFILHLAAFYDFLSLKNPEYERTNINGTKNLLEIVKDLNLKRFIFASSLTISDFKKATMPVNEKSPANANFPYAQSKKIGENMVEKYSKYFPCSIIRFAAVFSDWCEYGPLYSLISTWVSGKWNSRIIGGKGKTAITYVHINCLVLLIQTIFENTEKLKKFDIYLASQTDPISHKELFELTTRLFYGYSLKPIFLPKPLAALGIILRNILGKISGNPPFEKPWMLQYIDNFISADPKYTLKTIPFNFRTRYCLKKRMIYLIENIKQFSGEWHTKNSVILQRDPSRPNLLVSDILFSKFKKIIGIIFVHLSSSSKFPSYQKMDPDKLRWYIELIVKLLGNSIRYNNRLSVLSYIRYISSIRNKEGFSLEEFCNALSDTGEIIFENLIGTDKLKNMEQYLNDQIKLTMEMAVGEAEDSFTDFSNNIGLYPEKAKFLLLADKLNEIEDLCVDNLHKYFMNKSNKKKFPNYQKMDSRELHWHLKLFFKLLVEVIQNNDKTPLISYYRYLSEIRKKNYFPMNELITAFRKAVKLFIDTAKQNSDLLDTEKILQETLVQYIEPVCLEIEKVYAEIPII